MDTDKTYAPPLVCANDDLITPVPIINVPADSFIASFLKVQKAIPPIRMSSVNTFFNDSPYATLQDIRVILLPILHENNFILMQYPEQGPDGWRLVTELVHVPDKSVKSYFHPFNCKDLNDPQKFGSSETYACRYALTHIFSLVLADPSDDDGNKGAGKDPKDKAPAKPAAPSGASPAPSRPPNAGFKLSQAQINRAYALAWSNNNVSKELVNARVAAEFKTTIENLTKAQYEELCAGYL